MRLAREGDGPPKNACSAILVQTPPSVSGVGLYSSNNVPTVRPCAFSRFDSPAAEDVLPRGPLTGFLLGTPPPCLGGAGKPPAGPARMRLPAVGGASTGPAPSLLHA